MSAQDYKAHLVSRDTFEKAKIGTAFSGGILINAMACGVTGALLLITYHGPEGEALPLTSDGRYRSAPMAQTEAKRQLGIDIPIQRQGALDV